MMSYGEAAEYTNTIHIDGNGITVVSKNIDRKTELYLDIMKLKEQLNDKQEELLSICDHKHFNGQSAFIEYKEIKECSICGYKNWA